MSKMKDLYTDLQDVEIVPLQESVIYPLEIKTDAEMQFTIIGVQSREQA